MSPPLHLFCACNLLADLFSKQPSIVCDEFMFECHHKHKWFKIDHPTSTMIKGKNYPHFSVLSHYTDQAFSIWCFYFVDGLSLFSVQFLDTWFQAISENFWRFWGDLGRSREILWISDWITSSYCSSPTVLLLCHHCITTCSNTIHADTNFWFLQFYIISSVH